jgi:ferric-dicitrate binding protein FerR (iron transport regulator)
MLRRVGGAKVRTVWYRYAAAVLLLVGIGTYLFYMNRSQGPGDGLRQDLSKVVDIPPGGDRAVLTLSDGSRIALDSAGNGILSEQGNSKVVKSGSGRLAYTAGSGISAGAMTYNSITTPRGGQYQVVLPDGSKVWLNASSSLRFPTAFRGRDRTVEITGEAYFIIAKDVERPFFVKAGALSVAVLSTEFNINTYADEPVIRTTLLEGGVRLLQGNEVAVLSPGQQAQILNAPGAQNIKISKDADLEEAVAWKNGRFHLASADVGAIMRQLSRWYDVEVIFEGGIPSGHITGELPRNTSLLKTLQVFETSGIHFRVEDRKIIVTP